MNSRENENQYHQSFLSSLYLGSMYKLKFENAAVANIWFQHLKEATTFKQNTGRLTDNLIALD